MHILLIGERVALTGALLLSDLAAVTLNVNASAGHQKLSPHLNGPCQGINWSVGRCFQWMATHFLMEIIMRRRALIMHGLGLWFWWAVGGTPEDGGWLAAVQWAVG